MAFMEKRGKDNKTMKKNVHIISHSHWDREWYMPFEYHRARLIQLIDDCMELFEEEEDFKSFHLDGHTILIEDYLEIKPQNEGRIRKYVEEGKFAIGPWYVLQDEFLTSAEANIRNLLVGMGMARRFGKITPLGYFPDTFGNAGQMPQILKQAGMKAAAFGRGVKPTGRNHSVLEGDTHQTRFSELYWQSPDGSMMPSVLFANWYCNGREIPVDADRSYWDPALRDVEKYAAVDNLLLMNGCDHQPVQRDLPKALEAARREYPDYNFIHSSFEEYVGALREGMPQDLAVCRGELTGQDTDGWSNLINTASSHVDLKIQNRRCENLLEHVAEPLAVIASRLGKKIPHEMLLYAWKTLMKNHTHDSICGCGCDAVNEEMQIRFQKSRQAAETVIHESLAHIAQHIDIGNLQGCDAVFAVFNTFAGEQRGVVSIDADLRRIYDGDIHKNFRQIQDTLSAGPWELIDREGRRIPCSVGKPEARFGYDLPAECFRKPYVAETVTVELETDRIPAMGYQVYGLRRAAGTDGSRTLVTGKNTMENSYIQVSIHPDGAIDVLDKAAGRKYCGLLRFEDVGDLGSEYTFVPVEGDVPVLSGELPAEIELACDEPYKAEYRITVRMRIPEAADEQAEWERNTYVDIRRRKGGRSREFVSIPVTSYVSLAKNGRSVKVRTELTNTARDHRLRVLFPTVIRCSRHKAESLFEAVTRDNCRKSAWTYPSGCDRQQGFVMLEDEISGLAIGNIGLYEYEILNGNTIALTLLRAVGEMGDWGIFPTERSQMRMPLSFDYEITPFVKESEAWMELAAFQYPLQTVQITKSGSGSLENGEFVWEGACLKPYAFKPAQERDDIIMRWANYSDREQTLTIRKTNWIHHLYRSNVIEDKGEALVESGGEWKLSVKPFEIITVGCTPGPA